MAKYKGWVALALWEGNGGHFQNCLHFPRAGQCNVSWERYCDCVTMYHNVTFSPRHLCSPHRDKIEIKPALCEECVVRSLSLGLISAWHFVTPRDATWHPRLVTDIKTELEGRAFEMLMWNVTTWYHKEMRILRKYFWYCPTRWLREGTAIRSAAMIPIPGDQRWEEWGRANGFPIIDTNDIITQSRHTAQ